MWKIADAQYPMSCSVEALTDVTNLSIAHGLYFAEDQSRTTRGLVAIPSVWMTE